MPNEITLEFVLNSINKRIDGLQDNIKDYHDAFVKFEEGKLTQALQDIEKSKGDIRALQTQNTAQNTINTKNSDRRKDWLWVVLEKIISTVIGALLILAGLVLSKLGILNLK